MKEMIPAHLGLYLSQRRGLGVEATHGKCQLSVQTMREEHSISCSDCRSSSIVPSASSEPGTARSLASGWGKAFWAGSRGGFHFVQWADMHEPNHMLVLRVGVGIKQ